MCKSKTGWGEGRWAGERQGVRRGERRRCGSMWRAKFYVSVHMRGADTLHHAATASHSACTCPPTLPPLPPRRTSSSNGSPGSRTTPPPEAPPMQSMDGDVYGGLSSRGTRGVWEVRSSSSGRGNSSSGRGNSSSGRGSRASGRGAELATPQPTQGRRSLLPFARRAVLVKAMALVVPSPLPQPSPVPLPSPLASPSVAHQVANVLDAAYNPDHADDYEPYTLSLEVKDVPGVLNQVRAGPHLPHASQGEHVLLRGAWRYVGVHARAERPWLLAHAERPWLLSHLLPCPAPHHPTRSPACLRAAATTCSRWRWATASGKGRRASPWSSRGTRAR